jgi:hypothetical protein
MKPRFVSAVAMLFCCAVFMIVGLFGYWRYRAAQSENAAFGKQLLNSGADSPASIGTVMPAQLPARANPGGGEPSPSSTPGQQ